MVAHLKIILTHLRPLRMKRRDRGRRWRTTIGPIRGPRIGTLRTLCAHKASPTTMTTAMAQLPLENIATMPTQKVVFNAPFDNKATYYVRVINHWTKRIGYAFKTTKPERKKQLAIEYNI